MHLIRNKSIRRRILANRMLHLAVCLVAALTAVPLLAIVGKVVVEGVRNFTWAFLTQPTPTAYKALMAVQAGDPIPGGIANGIVGTLLMLFVASLAAIPTGIMCGFVLSERRDSGVAKVISYLTDLLQGTPSIIIGIIVYAWVVIPMRGYSAWAGSLALFIMMLPLIIRSTEEALNLLPAALKEAAAALGGSYWRTALFVLLPSALGSICTGILLAMMRVVGETAPLMFTALGCSLMQWHMGRPMSSVPLLIWQFFNDPTLQPLVWSAALFLLLVVLTLNIIAKLITKKWKTQ